MAEIFLSNGMRVLVDDSDMPIVAGITWCAAVTRRLRGEFVYACGWDKENKRSVFMHRLLLAAERGQFVDHANGDTLDNRRGNIRIATRSQNAVNSVVPRGISGYRGVSRTRYGWWRAVVQVDGKNHCAGTAKNPADAARLYDEIAHHFYGEFAVLNFPRPSP